MMMNRLLLVALLGSGCAVNTIQRTNELEPGMSSADVVAVMGKPSTTQYVAERRVWRYSLQQAWKGYVPYYLVFGADERLDSWYADESEYQAQQALWLKATAPRTVKVQVVPIR